MLEKLSYELYLKLEKIEKQKEELSRVITSKDLLEEIIKDEDGYFDYILNHYKISKVKLLDYIKNINKEESLSNEVFINMYLSINVICIYNKALKACVNENSKYIYTEHIIYAMLDEYESSAYDILNHFIFDLDKLKSEYENVFDYKEINEDFLINLTKENKRKSILVGRAKELEKIEELISRYKKRNVILVGDSGVGKTEIVYELVRRLKKKNRYVVYELLLSTLISNTKYRGDLESKIDKLKDIINKENVILFIDEIHSLLTYKEQENNLSNYLKPILLSGVIVIGATTINEYNQTIVKDGAFKRRFTKIEVQEPSLEETIDIVLKSKKEYEKYHNVKINDETIKYLVNASNRITMQKFPDKSFDLLDITLSKCKLNKKKEVTKKDIDLQLYDILNIKYYKNNLQDDFLSVYKKDLTIIKTNSDQLSKKVKSIKEMFDLNNSDVFNLDLQMANESDYFNYLGAKKGYVAYESGGLYTNFLMKKELQIVVIKGLNEKNKLAIAINQSLKDKKIMTNNEIEISLINKIFIVVNEIVHKVGLIK